MNPVFNVVFPVFLVVAAGYLFGRFKKISLEPIIEILLYLTIPALVLSTLTQEKFLATDLIELSMAAATVVLGCGALSFVYLRATGQKELRGFYLPTMFMNSGNMSFPLALLAFGSEGLGAAIVYYIAVGVMVYSLGIYIAKGEGGYKEMFKLPLIYAAAIGLTLNMTGAKLPASLETAFEMLGAATIPLMQISLGYKLHSAKLSSIGNSLAASAIRIGGGILVAYFIVTAFGIGGINGKIIILSSAMPSAVINFVISYRYKIHGDLVASSVVVSTLLSIVTTPLVLWWIM